jgi:23S rRNA (cytidine1920-2'-O)/16S rRNA (cytidine1409-2'-O)-methyltransferase
MKTKKYRLDVLLVERALVQSRQRAVGLILAGQVLVEGQRVTKAGTRVPKDASVRITGIDVAYVSRGGIKLEAALKEFRIDVSGFRCLDVGASTGGFTDCLLQHGADHVTAVDVGYGQLHWKLRTDPRVNVHERTNIRYFDQASLRGQFDFACIDVSFISLKIVVPAVLPYLKETGLVVCLIKPQFEVGKGLVGKGGIVSDPALRQHVIDDLTDAFLDLNLRQEAVTASPVLGPKGNQEYLALLTLKTRAVNII